MPIRKQREDVPVEYEEYGSFVLWDLTDWDGDIVTLAEANDAWLDVHSDDDVVGTILVLPDHVIDENQLQEFMSEGWNGGGQAAGLQYLAIVGDGLGTRAVKNQIDTPDLDLEVFQDDDAAVNWLADAA